MAGQDLSLESQVQSLSRALAELSERVRVLEGRGVAEAPARDDLPREEVRASQEETVPSTLAAPSAGGIAALAGRAVLVLAGGFLLRAVSDAGIAPKLAVALVGMLYAATWMLMALRRKGEMARTAALFDVGAGALVAFPLIAEVTVRFALLSAPLGAGATLAFAGLTTWLGLRLRQNAIIWTGGWFGAGTMLALAFGTHAFLPVILALVVGAAGLEALAFAGREARVRWIVALALNVTVAAFLVVLTGGRELPESYPPFSVNALAVALVAMAAVYLGGTAARSLLRGREVDAFDAIQVPLAALLGLGGAFAISPQGGGMATLTAALLLFLGLGGYGLSFTYADRRQGHTRNFYFYSTIGGLMLLFGRSLLMEGGFLPLAWAALGVVSAALGVRFDRFTLRLHGAIYVFATFLAGGLYPRMQERLVASPSTEWSSLGAFGIGAMLLTMVCALLLSRRKRKPTASTTNCRWLFSN